jgi:hypothetical protein
MSTREVDIQPSKDKEKVDVFKKRKRGFCDKAEGA